MAMMFKVTNHWRQNIETSFCYRFPYKLNGIPDGVLDDISNAKLKPEGNRSIFFIITTCSKNNEIALNPIK